MRVSRTNHWCTSLQLDYYDKLSRSANSRDKTGRQHTRRVRAIPVDLLAANAAASAATNPTGATLSAAARWLPADTAAGHLSAADTLPAVQAESVRLPAETTESR